MKMTEDDPLMIPIPDTIFKGSEPWREVFPDVYSARAPRRFVGRLGQGIDVFRGPRRSALSLAISVDRGLVGGRDDRHSEPHTDISRRQMTVE